MAKDIDPKAWHAAKAGRDEALAAAWALENPDERMAAVQAAKDAWAAKKAKLLGK